MRHLFQRLSSATYALGFLFVCSFVIGCADKESNSASEPTLSLLNQLENFPFKAHDPSRIVEVAPGVLGFFTTTDSNDADQRAALKFYYFDTNALEPRWESQEHWTFGTSIPGVQEWHLPWMMQYGYRVDGVDDYHRELAVVAPTLYNASVVYFTLWNEPGAEDASNNGDEGAMYRAIYRAVAEGVWPHQTWRMEPYPVYYSDTKSFEAGMPRGIDAHVWTAENGSLYMTFGSWDPEGSPVIVIAEMDERTGRIRGLSPNEPGYYDVVRDALHPIATFGEAAFSYYRNGWYYLFLNLGSCCRGTESTYEIVVGRSRSVYGPYFDDEDRSFADTYDYDDANFPGRSVLRTTDRFIGPGHSGIFEHANGQTYLSFHYYDGNSGGTPRFALRRLGFSADGWPFVDPVLD